MPVGDRVRIDAGRHVDVGDKLNAELSTYGSNITVQPKADAVVSDLYNTKWAAQRPPATRPPF